jgi:hypothetical protein
VGRSPGRAVGSRGGGGLFIRGIFILTEIRMQNKIYILLRTLHV